MSVSALTWVVVATTLFVLSWRRSTYAVALYMLTFFAAPHLWWWGGALPSLRYALIAGLTLLAAVLYHGTQHDPDERPFGLVRLAAVGMALNATFVHFVVASAPAVSINNYIELLKYVLLFFLMAAAIRTRSDLRAVILAIALSAAYLGYEVTVNERGDFTASRLEGVGAPGADTSNSLASVMLLVLPLAGSLFIAGKARHKITAAIAAPLVLNVVLMCNSRGAFLGLIGGGLVFLLISRGPTRKRAITSLALGALALFILLGDPKILDRFATTFVGSEERDASAAGRVVFWKAGLRMLADYPLGDGGGAFKFIHAPKYLADTPEGPIRERSLHNGYLTEATEWGIQGFILRMLFIGAACAIAYRTTVKCRLEGRVSDSLLGICLIVALAAFLIATMFGSFFTNEWSYWIIALLARYGEIYAHPESSAASVTHPSTTVDAGARKWASAGMAG